MGRQRHKVCLILDSMPFRYQQFISDIAGQDIQVHNSHAQGAITVIRNWLRSASGSKVLPGGMEIYRRFQRFQQDLPALCRELRLQRNELTFSDSASIDRNRRALAHMLAGMTVDGPVEDEDALLTLLPTLRATSESAPEGDKQLPASTDFKELPGRPK